MLPVSYFLDFIIDCLQNEQSLFDRAWKMRQTCARTVRSGRLSRYVIRGKGSEMFLLGKNACYTGYFFFIQIRRNKCLMFWRSLQIWITANGSIYKISALVDIFHFQFSTSIPPRTLLATPIKTKIWILSIPELPPFQPEVNRGKQLVATWFTLVAPKSENLFSI